NHKAPYAYQHSSIRDVATICDILDLVKFFKAKELGLTTDVLVLFEQVAGNTINDYHKIYQQNTLDRLPEGNIGDLGFFLLALLKCSDVFPSQLPKDWEQTKNLITKRLIERQNPDGSLEIFFDESLKSYEKNSEAFYLPEALIGLIAVLERSIMDQNIQIENSVQRAISYLCQEENRNRCLTSAYSTFYFNWQAQLLFHWIKWKQKEERANLSIEETHLKVLIEGIRKTRITKVSFISPVATVEVACYLEGLVHAKKTLDMLHLSSILNDRMFEKEIEHCLLFLYEI